MDLCHQSDRELLEGVTTLVGSHRKLTAKLVAYLAEIEDRRLHLEAGFPSMFEFCRGELKLSEGEAFRRILAARLGRRFPVVYSLLASGAVHLSALVLVRERLTEENHAEVLDAVAGKSKHEIEAFLAARFPRRDVPSRIRRLPPARIEPLSEVRFRVEFTASAELREKLELCRDLMSHSNPSRELGAVFERAVDLLLVNLEKKRLARTKRARREPSGSSSKVSSARGAKPGRIPSATRRHVYERDGLRCTYVSPDGRRCAARAFLELDHAEPRALGGGDDPENLRVRCRAHNQLWAEQVFGREHVEHRRRFRQRRQRKCTREARATNAASSEILEKVGVALKGLGFRDTEARRAVAEVRRMLDDVEAPTLEQALRQALLVIMPRAG